MARVSQKSALPKKESVNRRETHARGYGRGEPGKTLKGKTGTAISTEGLQRTLLLTKEGGISKREWNWVRKHSKLDFAKGGTDELGKKEDQGNPSSYIGSGLGPERRVLG